ncbi:cystathionine gamma-synthase [Aspergillus steynii IBT 23096]|uniref:Cystathionine gamma-synthase n=1 Tax=Aspergillus steynii IBT 23096 TaxID=1392250 RepID=A0A2I2GBH1_9EURO|nr:cystathionine gamma-synthase [Aspergillus steynii IBT 23096]PLB50230.1 cystathionine gamma-synthase [Aspergillus steynii IBT 23096]
MALPQPSAPGLPIPNAPHAVSVQLSSWKNVCGVALGETQVLSILKNGYPRSFLHKDVQALFRACETKFAPGGGLKVMLFSSPRAAEACKSYIASVERHKQQGDISDWIALTSLGWEPFSPPQSQSNLPMLYAVTYPEGWHATATTFWRLAGLGISSRLSEKCLERVETMRKMESMPRSLSHNDTEVYSILQSRIATLIERAAITDRPKKVAASDVHLYPSGMAAIYTIHQMLLRWRGAESAIVGFPYELTIKMLETYGPRYSFYSAGTDREIDLLEAHLEQLASTGQKLQAVWCECPSNPLLRTIDLDRIRRLATKYDFVVVVDDTIGSYANVDVLDIADIVITSLTKSFNGFADVLAGRQVLHLPRTSTKQLTSIVNSAILNPNSPYHSTFHSLLHSPSSSNNNSTLYLMDAIQLELNSRDFLTRTATTNTTAEYLVDTLIPHTLRPNSPISTIYYPKHCWSAPNYRRRMRRPTPDFVPGYGYLFTLEFKSVGGATAFLDALEVHKGPSIGAHVTLALPYVQMVMQREKKWAEGHGLRESIVRISVGLEDKEALAGAFGVALREAERVMDDYCD